jgi:hypothetical protein
MVKAHALIATLFDSTQEAWNQTQRQAPGNQRMQQI